MGSQPSHTTTTSTTSPPSWAVPAEQRYLSGLEQNYFPGGTFDKNGNYIPPQGGMAPSPYPNQQVAPLSQGQVSGIEAINQMGGYSPIAGTAGAQDIATARGDYLGPNPALNAYYNAAAQNMTNQYQQSTAPGITAAAVQAGGLGGTGQNQAEQYAKWGLGQNLGNLAANVYEPAYEAERGRQLQAAGLAPSLTAAQYTPAEMQMQAGGLQQSQLQNILNTGYQNQLQQNLWPYTGMQQFGAGLGTIQGGTQNIVAPNLSQGMK